MSSSEPIAAQRTIVIDRYWSPPLGTFDNLRHPRSCEAFFALGLKSIRT